MRVLEAGVRHRCKELGLGKKKSARADGFPDAPYVELVDALHKAGKIPHDKLDFWKVMVALRNTFSHQTRAYIRKRHEAVQQLTQIADLLNRLFK